MLAPAQARQQRALAQARDHQPPAPEQQQRASAQARQPLARARNPQAQQWLAQVRQQPARQQPARQQSARRQPARARARRQSARRQPARRQQLPARAQGWDRRSTQAGVARTRPAQSAPEARKSRVPGSILVHRRPHRARRFRGSQDRSTQLTPYVATSSSIAPTATDGPIRESIYCTRPSRPATSPDCCAPVACDP